MTHNEKVCLALDLIQELVNGEAFKAMILATPPGQRAEFMGAMLSHETHVVVADFVISLDFSPNIPAPEAEEKVH